MSVTVTLISPTGKVLGTATSATTGAPAVLPVVQSSKGGTYEIVITGGSAGLNIPSSPFSTPTSTPRPTAVASNGSIATATPIDPYANKFAGNDSRTAVLGAITGSPASFGDALVVQEPYGFTGEIGEVTSS